MASATSSTRLARGLVKSAVVRLLDIPTFLCPALLGIRRIRSSTSSYPQPRLLTQHAQSRFSHAEAVKAPEIRKPELTVPLQALPIQCPGCGALGQTMFEEEPGFYKLKRRSVNEFIWGLSKKASEEDLIVEAALKNAENESLVEQFSSRQTPNFKPIEVLICDRCHKLKHHQLGVSIDHPTLRSIQDTIYESPYKYNHVYHVLDAADIPMSLIPGLHKLLHLTPQRSLNRRSKTGKFYSGRKTEVSFIITRSDLLAPKKEQVDSLMPYLISVLRDALGRAGKDVRLGNVRCVSAKRGWWTKELKEDIWKRGGGGWMVGKVNVGKSQLFHEVFPKGRLHHGADGKSLPNLASSGRPLASTIPASTSLSPQDNESSFVRDSNAEEEATRSTEHDTGYVTTGDQSPQDTSSELQEVASPTANTINKTSQTSLPISLGTNLLSTTPLFTSILLPPLPPSTAYPPMPLISSLPGTTASPIRHSFGSNKGELIDLPGLSRSTLETHIQPSHRRSLVMQSRIVPEQKVLKAGQSLLLGGFIRIAPVTKKEEGREVDVVLAYCFTPLTPHLTATPKAIAIQTHSPDAPSGVENISLQGTGERIRSAGVFKLKWDVTRQRTGPITRRDAAGIKPDRLPYRVMATDLLVEGVGWVEVVAQVRRRRKRRGIGSGEGIADGKEMEWLDPEMGGKGGLEQDGTDDVDIPEVEVFTPEGKFIGQRRPMNAWQLVSNKPGVSKLRGRPRRAMKGVKKLKKMRSRVAIAM